VDEGSFGERRERGMDQIRWKSPGKRAIKRTRKRRKVMRDGEVEAEGAFDGLFEVGE
jgi:hypothetical protein